MVMIDIGVGMRAAAVVVFIVELGSDDNGNDDDGSDDSGSGGGGVEK